MSVVPRGNDANPPTESGYSAFGVSGSDGSAAAAGAADSTGAAICLGLGPYLFSPACESKHIQTIIQTAVIISTANPTPVYAIPLPFPPSISTLPIIIRIVQTNATP